MSTHTVTNQAPPRVELDEYSTNLPLVEGVERYDAGGRTPSCARSARTSAASSSRTMPAGRTGTHRCCTRTTDGGTESTRSSTTPRTTA